MTNAHRGLHYAIGHRKLKALGERAEPEHPISSASSS